MQSPLQSFLSSVIGFAVFLSVSFGVTYAVHTYTVKQEKEKQTAAALQAMLGMEKWQMGSIQGQFEGERRLD